MTNGVSTAELKLTLETAKEIWDYDPVEGTLTWKQRSRDRFSSENRWLKYNESKAGTSCGTLTKRGYVVVSFDGTQYYVHRLVWLLSYGEWPSEYIDHINRDKSDNKLENLRIVSSGENSRNVSKSSRNTSGQVGVSYCDQTEIWRARWSNLDGSRGYFGRSARKWGFDEAKRLATEAYEKAMAELNLSGAGYTEGHGLPATTPEFVEPIKSPKKEVRMGRVISYGNMYWRVQYDNGSKSKMFSVNKYGEDKAKQLAQEVFNEISKLYSEEKA